MNHNPMNVSLSRFQESTLPFEAVELTQEQIDHIHQYVEDEMEHEQEIPCVHRILYVFDLHQDFHDEVENLVMMYDGEKL